MNLLSRAVEMNADSLVCQAFGNEKFLKKMGNGIHFSRT